MTAQAVERARGAAWERAAAGDAIWCNQMGASFSGNVFIADGVGPDAFQPRCVDCGRTVLVQGFRERCPQCCVPRATTTGPVQLTMAVA